jgi:hypothetical protein
MPPARSEGRIVALSWKRQRWTNWYPPRSKMAERKMSAVEELFAVFPLPSSSGSVVSICVPTQTPLQIILPAGQVLIAPDGGLHAGPVRSSRFAQDRNGRVIFPGWREPPYLRSKWYNYGNLLGGRVGARSGPQGFAVFRVTPRLVLAPGGGGVTFLPHGSGNPTTNSIKIIDVIDKPVALAASIEALLSQ